MVGDQVHTGPGYEGGEALDEGEVREWTVIKTTQCRGVPEGEELDSHGSPLPSVHPTPPAN